jgi:isopenicillin-N N-acyltransferase-like protein
VGRHGANSAGIAVLANGLSGFCTPEPGVPQPFIRRRLLDSWSFADALEVALTAKQQIAANLLLAHRDGFALDLETTPERRGWLYPTAGMLVHGNHYEAFSWARDGEQYRPLGADSLYRVWRLGQGLGPCREVGDREELLDTVAAALSDHFGFPAAVCTHADEHDHPLEQWQTLTSSIIDLTAGEWLLAAGVPCLHGFEPLPWNLYA